MADASLIAAAGALLGTTSCAAAYAVRGRSATVLAPSVYRGVRSRPALALTFDDGPSESTPALLEVLAEHQVRATFFMCGKNVRRCAAIAKQVAAEGHEIGNHTDSHPRLNFHASEFIYRELALAQETIHRNTGVTPRLFRPPFGVRWLGLRGAQKRLSLMGVMWTVIGHDWRWPARRVARLLTQRASNGAIICLHDGRELQRAPDIRATIDAVEYAIPVLKELGYRFETVSQILCPTIS